MFLISPNSRKVPSTLKVLIFFLILFIDEGHQQDMMIVNDMTQSIENDDEDDEYLLESGLRPFDEREQNQGEDSHLKKQQKSKLPFSFLIQNYFKNGAGEQQPPTNFLNVSSIFPSLISVQIQKPRRRQIETNEFIEPKMNNFMSNAQSGKLLNKSNNV